MRSNSRQHTEHSSVYALLRSNSRQHTAAFMPYRLIAVLKTENGPWPWKLTSVISQLSAGCWLLTAGCWLAACCSGALLVAFRQVIKRGWCSSRSVGLEVRALLFTWLIRYYAQSGRKRQRFPFHLAIADCPLISRVLCVCGWVKSQSTTRIS